MCCNANPTVATTTAALQEACLCCRHQLLLGKTCRHADTSQADELPTQQAAGQPSVFQTMVNKVLETLSPRCYCRPTFTAGKRWFFMQVILPDIIVSLLFDAGLLFCWKCNDPDCMCARKAVILHFRGLNLMLFRNYQAL